MNEENILANELMPAVLTHPGEVIKDEIECRGISQHTLSQQTGIAYSAINEMLNGRRAITEKTALLLEAALDISAETIMRMQYRYNMLKAKKDSSFMARVANIRKVTAVL